ncbi:MAG TPA: hypothetical protein VGI70_18480 [Polyangiales bacterium]|jgi:hypothetical protein
MKRWAAGWPTIGAAFALCIAGLYPIDNPDTFGHLAAGREIARLGRVPLLDSFSYFRSSPQPWVNYEWLSDLIFYTLFRAGGFAALTLFKLALLIALAALLVRVARDHAGAVGAAIAACVVIADLPGLRFRLSVRPHLFGMVLAALYLLGLSRIRSKRGTRAWMIALAIAHVAWVNLHGSHLLGLALIAIACATCAVEARRPLLGLFAIASLASCVSPYGPAIVSSALAHAFDPAYRELIEEWKAWSPAQPIAYPLVLLLQASLFAIAFAGLVGGRLRNFALAIALLTFAMAARSLRFIPDCLCLTAPFIAIGLARFAPLRRPVVLAAVGGGLAIAATLVCLHLPPRAAFGWGESLRGRPVASARWLEANLPDARIFAVMQDAWDLMFALPHAKFLIDGRTPFYGPEHVRRVQAAWGSPPALRALLDQTDTEVVVAEPEVSEQQPALHALLGYEDFALVMIEDGHCLFARRTARRRQLLEHASLHALRPGYDAEWLLARDADVVAIRAELARLDDYPNSRGYRDWVSGMLAARPLARVQSRAGFSSPRDAVEHSAVARALALVRRADQTLQIVPSVMAYHALLATAACRLDEAREVLERAAADGGARELLLGAQDLALRRGEVAEVRAFLDRASALPEANGDAWLAALRTSLDSPPLCAAR